MDTLLLAVTGFNWDKGNQRKNDKKHKISQSEAEQVFFNEPLLVLEDRKHSQSEPRFHTLGKTDEFRRLHVTFTLRNQGKWIRVISARDMSKNERRIYVQAKAHS